MAIASGSTLNAPKKIWYFNPSIDFLGLGLTAFVFLLVFYGLETLKVNLTWVVSVTYFLSILVNYPHYAATYHRVYRNWDEIKAYTFETLWVPLILFVLGFASLFSINGLAPWYVAGYIFFSGYHYSGQSYGIALIFSRKAGLSLETWQKWCFLLPLYTVYLYPVVFGNTSQVAGKDFWGVPVPHFGLPDWAATVSLWTFYASFIAYIGMCIYMGVKKNERFPMIVHVVVGSQILWFSVGTMIGSFSAFVPFFHCLQYLVITSYFYFKELQQKEIAHPSGDANMAKLLQSDGIQFLKSGYFIKYYLVLIVVGALLFLAVPEVIALSGLAKFSVATAVVVSFLNIHHFILDAAIWKLRKPTIASPLID